MPNPIKGEVAFTSGGQVYTLVYNFDALVVLEDRFDKSVDEIIAYLARNRRVKNLAAALHPGLLAHHPDVTEAQAGALMMGIEDGKTPFELITDGITAAFPKRADVDDKDGEGADGPPAVAPAESPAADGITSTSSQSGASSPSDPPTTSGV
jgi:hypothetical protein